jgi:hypothetical protein
MVSAIALSAGAGVLLAALLLWKDREGGLTVAIVAGVLAIVVAAWGIALAAAR